VLLISVWEYSRHFREVGASLSYMPLFKDNSQGKQSLLVKTMARLQTDLGPEKQNTADKDKLNVTLHSLNILNKKQKSLFCGCSLTTERVLVRPAIIKSCGTRKL
jgi:hypothetical protein